MLGTGQADALCAQLTSLARIVRGVGIGADLEAAILVSPAHDAAELACDGGVNGGDDAVVDLTGGAVDGDVVALVVDLACQLELLVLLVHLYLAAAGDAALAHAAGDNCRVAGHTAANGQDALCSLHALDILGAGLETNQNDLFLALVPGFCVFSGEDDLAAGCAGGCAEALADRSCGLEGGSVELRVEQSVEVSRVDHQNGLLLVDHALVNEVARDLESRLSGTLAVAALEHVELAVLDGELHVLHVAVVLLKDVADLDEVGICLGELLCHLGDGHRGADAGDDVFALCVDEELAHQLLLAGCGVTGESDAGAGILVQVAEYHGHDVDCSTPRVGDVIVTTVDICSGVVPRTENGTDGFVKLNLRVGGEVLADLLLVLSLELLCELLEVCSAKLMVGLDTLGFLHLVDELLEVFLADFHNDVGEHLDEAAVGVVNKALELRIGVACDHCSNDIVVKTQIQDGIHHTGHGSACAGADGNEQGVGEIAKLLAVDLLHDLDVLHDLSHDLVVDLAAILIVLGAGFGGDGEALRHRQAYVGHLCKVCTLAAKQLAHVGIAFGKQIHILFAHCFLPFYNK